MRKRASAASALPGPSPASRHARLGYLAGYGETLTTGKLSEEQTSQAAEARWGQG